MPEDELLDLVDKNDVVVGTMLRSEFRAKGLSNARAINVMIKNSKGELWIPQRGPNKKTFPDAWDTSTAGYVSSGETYEEALARELMEECNIDVKKVKCRLLGKMTPHEHGTAVFMKVYEIEQDDVPNYNPEDFVGYIWINPEELIKRLEGGQKSKEDLPRILREFYLRKR